MQFIILGHTLTATTILLWFPLSFRYKNCSCVKLSFPDAQFLVMGLHGYRIAKIWVKIKTVVKAIQSKDSKILIMGFLMPFLLYKTESVEVDVFLCVPVGAFWVCHAYVCGTYVLLFSSLSYHILPMITDTKYLLTDQGP